MKRDMKITSLNNEKIKNAVKLVSSSAERREKGMFVCEGARLCLDAVLSGVDPYEVFYTAEAAEKYASQLGTILGRASYAYEIPAGAAAKISDTKNPQGIFTINKILDKSDLFDKIDCGGAYVALDNIQNPDNLGAISRTAEALGYDGIIAGGGCDIYNPKALRASMGALFRLNVVRCGSLASFLPSSGIKEIIATVPDDTAEKITDYRRSGGLALVIGNEGSGISAETLGICSRRITIPMRGRAESLNAAAAASICMWELSK